MPRTKLSTQVQAEKEYREEVRDPKKLIPERVLTANMYRVKYTGGGRLPKPLEGWFLTERDCQKAIDFYQAGL